MQTYGMAVIWVEKVKGQGYKMISGVELCECLSDSIQYY